MFFHGKRHLMLYTGRCHFYKRFRIKGVRHIVFYELPIQPHFYSEICNLTSVSSVVLLCIVTGDQDLLYLWYSARGRLMYT